MGGYIMLRRILFGLLLLTSGVASIAAAAPVVDHFSLLPAQRTWDSKDLFSQPGTFDVTCSMDRDATPLQGLQAVTLSYTERSSAPNPPPAGSPSGTFTATVHAVSIKGVKVTQYDPLSGMYMVNYTYAPRINPADFYPIPVTCVYTPE